MTPEIAVRLRLLEDQTFVDLVATRIYPGELPQYDTERPFAEQIPAVVYEVISDVDDDMTQEGDEGLNRVRIQYDCYAVSHPKARELAGVIKTAINGKSWVTEDGDNVELVHFDSGRDVPREAEEDLAPGVPVYRHLADYFVDLGKVA